MSTVGDLLRPVWVRQARAARRAGFTEDDFVEAMGGDDLKPEVREELRLLWQVES
jgi:hypothetical protein